MSDQPIRDRYEHIDVIDYGPTRSVTPPPLEQARIAIVTTAGLRPDGRGTWTEG